MKEFWDYIQALSRSLSVVNIAHSLFFIVAPEKAIKLAMNDLIRNRLKDRKSGEACLLKVHSHFQ